METISISEHHTITIDQDRIICRRTDVLSEEFKEKVYRFDQIWYVDYVPKQLNWWSIIFGNPINYEQGKIRIVFLRTEKRVAEYILSGDIGGKELKIIVSRINATRKLWKLSGGK